MLTSTSSWVDALALLMLLGVNRAGKGKRYKKKRTKKVMMKGWSMMRHRILTFNETYACYIFRKSRSLR